MPNWVYNNITVSGTKEDLIAFRDKASKLSPNGIAEDGSLTYKESDAQAISFWNFIEPTNKTAYYEAAHGTKPEGYEAWTPEEKMTYDLSFKTDGWYDWNVREWGTKWDACDADLDDNTDDKNPNLYYAFNTAWSIPEPIYKAITEQHPELSFQFYAEEEQGWGAEYESRKSEDGLPELALTKEWDIPDSHADYVERDRTCNCENDDDQDYWYDDCPRPETDFVVVVERRYIVKAQTAESAWEIAQDKLDELTAEDGSETFRVVDEHTGEHLFPKYEESEA
jgi:hypothetical protein